MDKQQSNSAAPETADSDVIARVLAQNAAGYEAAEVAGMAVTGYILAALAFMWTGIIYWSGYHIKSAPDRDSMTLITVGLVACNAIVTLGLSWLIGKYHMLAAKLLFAMMVVIIVHNFVVGLMAEDVAWFSLVLPMLVGLMVLSRLYPGLGSLAELQKKHLADYTVTGVEKGISRLFYTFALVLILVSFLDIVFVFSGFEG